MSVSVCSKRKPCADTMSETPPPRSATSCCSSRTPYGAPDAPVNATTIGAAPGATVM